MSFHKSVFLLPELYLYSFSCHIGVRQEKLLLPDYVSMVLPAVGSSARTAASRYPSASETAIADGCHDAAGCEGSHL